MRNKDGRRRGTATVELALLMPLLLFMFLIAVDYGRIFFYSQIVTNCARNGALYAGDPIAASQSTYANIQEAALADAADLDPPPTVTSASGTDAAGNKYVDVTVSWQFRCVTGYPGIPPTTNLSRTVRTRVAQATPN